MKADRSLYDAECVLVMMLAGGYALALLGSRLRARRPDLAVTFPVLVGLVVRVLGAMGLSLLPVASALRGPDEQAFLASARDLAAGTLLSDTSLDLVTSSQLHTWWFALQLRLLDAPELALRVTQATVACMGLMLMATAVYDLAGGRAATITAWLLALEPASVFFSGVLHKEAPLLLAEGLVAFGGVSLWRRPNLPALVPIITGCAIAVMTRQYAGWFLVAASALIAFHASLRGRKRAGGASFVLASLVVVIALFALPKVLATSGENLERLQTSQEANTSDSSNLKLEEVDYSTPGAIVTNLPRRIRDVLFRPYPWQLQNTRQQLGGIGTLVMLVCLLLFTVAGLTGRLQLMARAGPFVYMAAFLLVAYALSAGNAGTAFRYRTHIVTLALCVLVAVYQRKPRTYRAAAWAPPRTASSLVRSSS